MKKQPVKLVVTGQTNSWKFGFVISELVVGSGEQKNKMHSATIYFETKKNC